MKGRGVDASKGKVAAGITTYNPDIMRLEQNLKAVVGQVQKVIIVDNASDNLNRIIDLLVLKFPEITLIKHRANKGVACALNELLVAANDYSCDYLLFLDQDSICNTDLVSKLMKHIAPDIAIVSARVVDENRIEQSNVCRDGAIECSRPITSGSLHSVATCCELGGFSEALFIDFVDDEYDIRASLAGYRLLQVNDAVLKHTIGKLRPVGLPFPHFEHGKIVLRRAYSSGHSPMRHYYQVRNLLALRHRYRKYLNQGIIQLPSVVKFIIHSLIFEPNRIANAVMMIKGFHDYREVKIGD